MYLRVLVAYVVISIIFGLLLALVSGELSMEAFVFSFALIGCVLTAAETILWTVK